MSVLAGMNKTKIKLTTRARQIIKRLWALARLIREDGALHIGNRPRTQRDTVGYGHGPTSVSRVSSTPALHTFIIWSSGF